MFHKGCGIDISADSFRNSGRPAPLLIFGGHTPISNEMSASVRQPHWHRHLDVKRPLLPCADAQAVSISVGGLPTTRQTG